MSHTGYVRLVPVLAASIALVAGCGEERDAAPSAPPGGETELTVSVMASAPMVRQIRCPGAHECGRLARVDVADFKRDRHLACTQQYGGDWTATVSGTLHGRPLRTDFSLRDGCEISRWQRFEWLLGERLPQAITG